MKKKLAGEPASQQEETFVVWCGGIEPPVISEENEDEVTECTAQF